MVDSKIKLSIITVSYNAEKTIEQAINSVISQTYQNVEYIIIDGASTDTTVDIIRRYEKNISYWVSEVDSGIYDAMNKGVSYCTGDVIAFLNSDDYYLEGALEYVANYFERESKTEILCCEVMMEQDGKLISHKNPWEKHPEKLREGFMMYSHQGIFSRRRCFEEYGKFDLKYKITADYDWLLRSFDHKKKIVYSPENVAIFRYGGLSTNNLINTAEEVRQVALSAAKAAYKNQNISKQEYEVLCLKIEEMINKRYVQAYAKLSEKKEIHMKMFMEDNWLLQDGRYSIFGAGGMGLNVLSILQRFGISVECFIDNDSSKWGKELEGVIVRNPEEAVKLDALIIVASQFYQEEIVSQLKSMGLVEDNDYISCTKICDQIELVEK